MYYALFKNITYTHTYIHTCTFSIIGAIPQQRIVGEVNGTLWLPERDKYRTLHIKHILTTTRTATTH